MYASLAVCTEIVKNEEHEKRGRVWLDHTRAYLRRNSDGNAHQCDGRLING